MTNMPHCRFENTLLALKECHDVIKEMADGESTERLSTSELEAAKSLMAEMGAVFTTLSDRSDYSYDELIDEWTAQEVIEGLDELSEYEKIEDEEDEEDDDELDFSPWPDEE